ncbi:DUF1294 domain-containing protein [Salinimonas sp. HHU 13199]|uniref:DUF1294 domain-containing protein n=1 Tax=Salinimonas profundi TaxID=2729140 RepID=A0ABR8LQN2_9ALTE|nr:cold shock and DUF1294 domain-containing protein [Salinimonas profundi]MBD3586722.1 DUF1294 domain-containing protein [Salinimonas profundi]
MKYKGKIVQWNDEKGFGFVQPMIDSQRVFFHISALTQRGRRPANGDIVIYTIESDKQNKMRIKHMNFSGKQARKTAGSRVRLLPVMIAIGVIGGLLAMAATNDVPIVVPALYGVASLPAFAFYAKDKSAAKRGKWRTPESHLHLINLVGGWPGGLIAQTHLRHKSSKTSFLVTFWATVLVNMLILACYLEPSILQTVLQSDINVYR